MVVGTKQDLERVDLPFEEIEATVRIVSIMMVVMMRRRRFFFAAFMFVCTVLTKPW